MKARLTSTLRSALRHVLPALVVLSASWAAHANQAPTVSMPETVSGMRAFSQPANFTIEIAANDPDGSVTRVEFYRNGIRVGFDTTAPYRLQQTGLPGGRYVYRARATDNLGAWKDSYESEVVVLPFPTNQAPAVGLNTPSDGATFNAPATVSLSATATDVDGAVTKVDFYRGSTLIASDSSAPFAATDANLAAGSYAYSARATDNGGVTTTSAIVTVTVSAATNLPPTVSLISPTNGLTLPAPAAITVSASAADADGTISSVQVYRNGVRLADLTSAPYSYSDPSVGAGNYSYSVTAIDDKGAATASSVATVTVTAVPSSAATTLYYVFPDHLSTPREIADTTGTTVWQWRLGEPFGLVPPSEDPDGDSRTFSFNLRFAGQYFDRETGLFHNVNRDYDPQLGRYIQADPIGVAGGDNLYAYVDSNPLAYIDPLGLAKCENTAKGAAEGSALTSRAARREAMRDAGIPSSQQPVSQSRNASGREYSYDVPAPGGGTQRMSVQQQTMDRSHPGQAHWEAGRVKTDPETRAVRQNSYGRPALTNDKSKVDY